MLDCFFTPSSVAVIGASHTPGKIGHEILKNFVEGYEGKVYPINPNLEPILGLKVYPSIKRVPDKIDLAIIAIPAPKVPKVLKECVEKRVKGVIIISAGFSEIGEKGKKLEEKLKRIIERKRIRVLGPNVIGVYDSFSKVDTLFLSRERLKRPSQGNVAFISQSGAVGSTILDWFASEGIGISKFISYGNAMDVNEVDLLEYLEKDEKTKVIVAYLEGIKSEGKRFIEVLKRVTKRKPVIILKAGKTAKGMKAVMSHTGSLAGSAEVYSAIFRQAGAIEANNWEELLDYAKAFSTQPLPKGKSLLIITDGGGFGVLAADEAERQNLDLKELPKPVKKVLRKKFPPWVILSNPLDLTGDATVERYRDAIKESINYYDGIVAITLFQVPTLDESIVYMLAVAKKFGKPLLCCASGGEFTKNLSKKIEAFGVPVYSTPERAIKAFAALVNYANLKKR
jgi:acetyl coenzyme A synthetase (ADP forming)-like protein